MLLAAGVKVCRTCGISKPPTEFYASRTGIGGVRSVCKFCVDTTNRLYVQSPAGQQAKARANQTYQISDRGKRTLREWVSRRHEVSQEPRACSQCGLLKPAVDFSRDRKGHGGRGRECSPCKVDHLRGYYATALGRYNKQQAFHVRKARKLCLTVTPVSPSQWEDRLVEYGHRCAYCAALGVMTMEHVQPLARQGPHEIENIVPACRRCNCSKQDRTLLEWLVSAPDSLYVNRVG